MSAAQHFHPGLFPPKGLKIPLGFLLLVLTCRQPTIPLRPPPQANWEAEYPPVPHTANSATFDFKDSHLSFPKAFFLPHEVMQFSFYTMEQVPSSSDHDRTVLFPAPPLELSRNVSKLSPPLTNLPRQQRLQLSRSSTFRQAFFSDGPAPLFPTHCVNVPLGGRAFPLPQTLTSGNGVPCALNWGNPSLRGIRFTILPFTFLDIRKSPSLPNLPPPYLLPIYFFKPVDLTHTKLAIFSSEGVAILPPSSVLSLKVSEVLPPLHGTQSLNFFL